MAIIRQDYFASAGDWYEAVRALMDKTPNLQGEQSIRVSDWCGNVDLAGALALADKGWPEGRASMSESLTRAVARTQSVRAPAYSMDVGGAYPVVPLAVAGDPACMVTVGDEMRANRPVVRLVCEQWISAIVTPEGQINRGAAIVAHVDRLEDAGIRCELVARFSCSAIRALEGGLITDILAKACDAPVDVDKLAFLFAHPASLRRLHFKFLDHLPNKLAKAFVPGHGYPPTKECRTVEPGQILLLSANEHGDKYETPESAAVFVGEMIQAGIRAAKDCGCWPLDHAEPELVDAA